MDVRALHPSARTALPALERLAAGQDGVVTRHDVVAAGASVEAVRTMVRRQEWRRLLPGVLLVETHRRGLALQRSWARAAVLAVEGAVVAGPTAAVLHGLPPGPPTSRVHVARRAPVQVGSRPLVVHRWDPPVDHVVDLGGLPTTSRVRTVADLVPRLERPDALALLDGLLRSGDAEELVAASLLCAGRPGCVVVGDLWALADARAESVLESRVRLRCHDGGVPPDDLQVEVRDEHGVLLARGDMAFRRRRSERRGLLLLEADGADPHSTPEAVYRDRWRTNALVALGHDVVRCTWRDTLAPSVVPALVRRAL
ncbi:type IV toxin-antitoxin system AbiEi family antitoxin domain-containing protein [uncultured Pseudokineococcus sp.]|uniref:type IV toxin-antitoxin system AbiEi family antitoxin domain-containing protein n=1 Tax=uncultured Pseudokineococcus sp. TaxID=1642928 RepID=UPI0026058C9F|nr:type IV toxin-antitoxin system AbiEi family antitoxin domain-containing protein [uncultured Pseudokineococcus sp.]